MRLLRSNGITLAPAASALALVLIFPCACMIDAIGEITGPAMAIAVLAVSLVAIYSSTNLAAWMLIKLSNTFLSTLDALAFRPDLSGTEASRVRPAHALRQG